MTRNIKGSMPSTCVSCSYFKRFAGQNLPNTACTRRVGVAAFFGSFLAEGWFRQSDVISSRPPAGNARRWVADLQSMEANITS